MTCRIVRHHKVCAINYFDKNYAKIIFYKANKKHLSQNNVEYIKYF